MLIVKWCPITDIEDIPPFGEDLFAHISQRKGTPLHSSCSAWNLLYKVLNENQIDIKNVQFSEEGKPSFIDSSIFFSISHSRDVCAVAVADHPIGVDIEIVKEKYNAHLIGRSLCDNEKAIFDGDFTRVWSRKEAISKMIGDGITGYPINIDTTKYLFNEKMILYNKSRYWLVAAYGLMTANRIFD